MIAATGWVSLPSKVGGLVQNLTLNLKDDEFLFTIHSDATTSPQYSEFIKNVEYNSYNVYQYAFSNKLPVWCNVIRYKDYIPIGCKSPTPCASDPGSGTESTGM